MSIKIFTLCILYILAVRYMMNKQNNKEVDDIYNVKKKKNKNLNGNDAERGTAYNKSISDGSSSGNSPTTSQPTGPLSRNGF